MAFAESLPLDIAHEPVVAARRLGGSRGTGTDLGCTRGDRFGVVSELAPSRGGREAAVGRHARHVRHTQGVDEADFQRAAAERRSRQQAELRRLRATRPVRDPFADRPWDRPAARDWHARVTGRLCTPATTVTSRHERHEYPAGIEFTLVMSDRVGAVPVLDMWSTQAASVHDVELFTVDSVEVLEVLEVLKVLEVLEVLEEIVPRPGDTDFRLVTDEMRAQPRDHAKEQE
ncbi:hypothetical protein [Umezawaea sp. Da 62-37]|uniref:hypothetical protein n=1 Tax=Umezawaea sp. Da 62-37 TaxID=3075927 RepID=UPI0028F6CCDB|nr:hypothetical protein [Umezawaea sp. Da 62-37]WNV84901.1 hypothetical protein RM788_43200 [Umezawaea sp. Da 62-37]